MIDAKRFTAALTATKIRFTMGVCALLTFCAGLNAATIQFTCITDNNGGQCATLASQFNASVSTDTITFQNQGPTGSIAQIFFADDATFSVQLGQTTGTVVFAIDTGTPDHLPSAPASFTSQHYVAASNPAPTNGINAGESLATKIVFAPNSPSLEEQLSLGTFRVGIHVLAIGTGPTGGNSDSLLSTFSTAEVGGTPAPEPGAAFMLAAGAAIIAIVSRLRSARGKKCASEN